VRAEDTVGRSRGRTPTRGTPSDPSRQAPRRHGLEGPSDDVGGVQQVAIAHRDGVDLLRGCIPPCLVERDFDRSAVPRERARSLDLKDEPLHAHVGEDDVRPADLEDDVFERPVEHVGEQILDDLFGHLLNRSSKESSLQLLAPPFSEERPASGDALDASSV
jgi:hypothetical protein